MKTLIAAATAALLLAGSASAQTTAPAAPAPAGPQGGPVADIPVLPGSIAAPDCGNLYGLNGKAFCVSALLANVGTIADAYIADLEGKGWLTAGDDNRVVFVKRRDGGGCDGMQMQAFYDTTRPAVPTSLGYLAFATIPGNICAAQPGSAPASAPGQ